GAEQAGVEWDRPTDELAPLVVAATDGITLAYLNTRDRAVCERVAEATVTLLLGHVTRTRSS
ncbi:TetR/AcrR family transcriptional regulator, partial [Streptomyces sp. SID10244]|nr:TetR/AcrR family transcriptional regulator [Streptomyces sp. SID10244]